MHLRTLRSVGGWQNHCGARVRAKVALHSIALSTKHKLHTAQCYSTVLGCRWMECLSWIDGRSGWCGVIGESMGHLVHCMSTDFYTFFIEGTRGCQECKICFGWRWKEKQARLYTYSVQATTCPGKILLLQLQLWLAVCVVNNLGVWACCQCNKFWREVAPLIGC